MAISKARLDGKVAIITGAATGIGEAAARLFAAHGAVLVIADVKDDLGEAVATSIGHDRCKYKRCDVRDEDQVAALVDFAVEAYGRLDVMYSNAGIMGRAVSVLDMDMGELDVVLAVNARGNAAAIKHAARAMGERGGGAIVCTASLAATVGGLGPHAYTASKHAVLGIVRAAAAELGLQGIRVNCVSPAGVVTPMALEFAGTTPDIAKEVCKKMSPLRDTVLTPEGVAAAALFLASDEAFFVSGHNLVVDGGMTAAGPKPPEINMA